MLAWQALAYGVDGNPGDTISKLVLKDDVPIPVAKDGQVVIKVRSAPSTRSTGSSSQAALMACSL